MVPPLRKIADCIWEIPKTYKPCMRVPARVFANEILLEKMKSDATLEQVANVACLPGIYKYSIVLPDGHQGYGFPIGGVAAIDAEDGVISPGGIGYDINCLPPGTRVLTSLGCRVPIEDVDPGYELLIVDRSTGRSVRTRVIAKMARRDKKLIRIVTESGHEIRVTEDHPVLTDQGMIEAREIREGMRVALYPFEGVDYEEPESFMILTGEELEPEVRRELERRRLLPLTSRSSKLPILLKLIGYLLGNGTIHEDHVMLHVAREEGSELLRDIEILGFNYELSTVDNEHVITITSRELAYLLRKLGVADRKVPSWVFKLPLWMKRLILASLFGASLPGPEPGTDYGFSAPVLRLGCRTLLEDVANLLSDFGVRASIDYDDCSIVIDPDPENLLRLWSKIGYEYSSTKRALANAAIVYIRLLRKIKSLGVPVENNVIVATVTTRGTIISENVRTASEFSFRVPEFEEFVRERLRGEIVFDVVEDVRIEDYDGVVYDVTVEDENHVFVAEGFVVSNCGVRLIATNLTEKDVRPKLKQLVDTIFNLVPAGLGERGLLRLSIDELDRVLEEGCEWAVRKGYGWAEDLEYIEERGSWKIADASKVSPRAKQRGKDQLGTVGSGNHFVEIQKVDKIFDRKAAEIMGIHEEGQVTVMIHTGSRGLGHQVATDYLRIFEAGMRRWGLRLPDRELAAAPLKTREARDYIAAMAAAANFAWTNRQIIMHWVREGFRKVFGRDPDALGMHLIYDVAHNIAKLEEHVIDDAGTKRKVWVHRKGATRAFPPGRPE
ncbi:MAG: RNA-splicing ligase RtcB, partial [Crenarchaeota archaeon]|nr:RNA-splicing ligase RtcB [Thermoproteota archaeon]